MNPAGNRSRRNLRDISAACEAAVLLLFFRIALTVFPVRRIFRALTRGQQSNSVVGPLDARQIEAVRRVQWAVAAVSPRLPVEVVCFPQALAAYTMLRMRAVASTIVYGVARLPEGWLIAHTWVEAAGGFVIGGEGSERFSAIERWN
jgi:hypothetical protein